MKRSMRSRGLIAAATLLAVFGLGATCADIDKFYWIDDRIATGGQPKPGELAALKKEGFRTIINLREPAEYDAESEAAEARRLGLGYISIPVRTAEPKDEQVDAFLAALADRKVFPAFAHCGSGNRVGAFWMIARVLVDGWDIEDAEREAVIVGMKSANLREFARKYICRHRKAEPRSVPCANRSAGTD
ncbi:MAG: protein tyrosine phosphatase family protein [Acidobacteriota bacterium]|nr:protein tyrosine phosphatase family protein [Acidobacteriota bacterium]